MSSDQTAELASLGWQISHHDTHGHVSSIQCDWCDELETVSGVGGTRWQHASMHHTIGVPTTPPPYLLSPASPLSFCLSIHHSFLLHCVLPSAPPPFPPSTLLSHFNSPQRCPSLPQNPVDITSGLMSFSSVGLLRRELALYGHLLFIMLILSCIPHTICPFTVWPDDPSTASWPSVMRVPPWTRSLKERMYSMHIPCHWGLAQERINQGKSSGPHTASLAVSP